jgi:hypothetical protein
MTAGIVASKAIYIVNSARPRWGGKGCGCRQRAAAAARARESLARRRAIREKSMGVQVGRVVRIEWEERGVWVGVGECEWAWAWACGRGRVAQAAASRAT